MKLSSQMVNHQTFILPQGESSVREGEEKHYHSAQSEQIVALMSVPMEIERNQSLQAEKIIALISANEGDQFGTQYQRCRVKDLQTRMTIAHSKPQSIVECTLEEIRSDSLPQSESAQLVSRQTNWGIIIIALLPREILATRTAS